MKVSKRYLWLFIFMSGLAAVKVTGQNIVDSEHDDNVELTEKVISIDEISQVLRTKDAKGSLGVYVRLNNEYFNKEVHNYTMLLPMNIWNRTNLFEQNIEFYLTIEKIEKFDRIALFSFSTCCYGRNFSGKVKLEKDGDEWKVKKYDIEHPSQK